MLGIRLMLSAMTLLLALGCLPFGPRTVRADATHYNRAIVDSNGQQLLLNLVRMRYNDPWLFLSTGAVVAQYEVRGSANFKPAFKNGMGYTDLGTDLGIGYTERPTVNYSPVQGEEFSRTLMTPLRPEVLFLMAKTGWEVKTVMLAGLEGVNGLRNAHGGPPGNSPPRPMPS